jgi:NitT/TauT family transport system substrate-binding protein
VSRRNFLRASAFLGAASLLGISGKASAAPELETRTITLIEVPALCVVPQYLASQFLRDEGFEEVRFIRLGENYVADQLATGKADIVMDAAGAFLRHVDMGLPIVALAGIHLGCYELFAGRHVRAIRDLKDKTIPVSAMHSAEHVFLSSMLAYVGIDPRKDIKWIVRPSTESMRLLAEHKVDAYLAFPPEPQMLHDRNVGRVLVRTAVDRPWCDYYCCILTGNSDFVRRYPEATRRALRAFLKAADLCVEQPTHVADTVVELGFATNRDYVLKTLKEVRFNAWRTHDLADSLRFHGLRLREAGMLRSNPESLIERAVEQKYLIELKKALKT